MTTFGTVIGNPPYQEDDGGHGKSAGSIYPDFVRVGSHTSDKYETLIIPARWYSGGKGLDEFRLEMLGDKKIVKLADYESYDDVFTSQVDLSGGVCYFLRDGRTENGLCEVSNCTKDKVLSVSTRRLDEFDTFIRQPMAVDIVHKVIAHHGPEGVYLQNRVSPRKPFSLPTNYEPRDKGVPCWFIQKIGLKFAEASDVDDSLRYLNKWKLLAPKAPIAGQTDFSKPVGFYYDGNTRIAKPGECCTESWVVLGAFSSKKEAESYKSYIFTKTVRFLLLQAVVSQDVTRKNYKYVPDLGTYDEEWTDEKLRERWGITVAEWKFIDSRITAVKDIAVKKGGAGVHRVDDQADGVREGCA